MNNSKLTLLKEAILYNNDDDEVYLERVVVHITKGRVSTEDLSQLSDFLIGLACVEVDVFGSPCVIRLVQQYLSDALEASSSNACIGRFIMAASLCIMRSKQKSDLVRQCAQIGSMIKQDVVLHDTETEYFNAFEVCVPSISKTSSDFSKSILPMLKMLGYLIAISKNPWRSFRVLHEIILVCNNQVSEVLLFGSNLRVMVVFEMLLNHAKYELSATTITQLAYIYAARPKNNLILLVQATLVNILALNYHLTTTPQVGGDQEQKEQDPMRHLPTNESWNRIVLRHVDDMVLPLHVKLPLPESKWIDDTFRNMYTSISWTPGTKENNKVKKKSHKSKKKEKKKNKKNKRKASSDIDTDAEEEEEEEEVKIKKPKIKSVDAIVTVGDILGNDFLDLAKQVGESDVYIGKEKVYKGPFDIMSKRIYKKLWRWSKYMKLHAILENDADFPIKLPPKQGIWQHRDDEGNMSGFYWIIMDNVAPQQEDGLLKSTEIDSSDWTTQMSAYVLIEESIRYVCNMNSTKLDNFSFRQSDGQIFVTGLPHSRKENNRSLTIRNMLSVLLSETTSSRAEQIQNDLTSCMHVVSKWWTTIIVPTIELDEDDHDYEAFINKERMQEINKAFAMYNQNV